MHIPGWWRGHAGHAARAPAIAGRSHHGFLLLGTDSLIATEEGTSSAPPSTVPAHASVWFSAGEQTLSSAVQAGIGLLIAWGLVALSPLLKRQVSPAFAHRFPETPNRLDRSAVQ